MAFLTGKYYFTLDPKGRVMIPAALRDVIVRTYNSPTLYITIAAVDKCIQIFPVEEWRLLLEEVKKKAPNEPTIKFFMRRVVASAVECEIDRQGRVLIPASLREDAEIKSEIVVLGLVNRIEVWDKSLWESAMDPSKVYTKAIEAGLAQLGL